MINKFVNFPIWKNDGEAVVELNSLQKKQINNFLSKIKLGEYRFIRNTCLCGNLDEAFDIVIAEKDRFGIPCINVLCKNCGLVRVKERLNDYSTSEFYKNEYRDIYVGKRKASESFFKSQSIRGEVFYNLVNKYTPIDSIGTVFEVGCGAGGILHPFYKQNKKVSGCDFGEQYLEYGKGKGLNLYKGEIDPNKTLLNSQDLIILSHVMEHFNEPVSTMNRIIKYVTPGKYILVEVPGVFNIPKTYFNPITYFQNAHIYNYNHDYLMVFFESLGLEVIYGDERCTFILKKPNNWRGRANVLIKDAVLNKLPIKVEARFKRSYLQYIFKLNPYYHRIILGETLDFIGLKKIIKKILNRS